MRAAITVLLLAVSAAGQQLPHDDTIRLDEFYRLASQIQDTIWPEWSKTPAPVLLVTESAEFLSHSPAPPKDFIKIAEDLYLRPRKFDPHLLATFPAFGPPAVIVVGEPQSTEAKTSTPWLIALMHEHFHQLQDGQPGYFDALEHLGLNRGDTTGMWMLNYPFPYEKPEVARAFSGLRDRLLQALAAANHRQFRKSARTYVAERKRVFAHHSPNDHKYFSFQLWQEGMARYTQIEAAEAAASYHPTSDYAALADYESFATYAASARSEMLSELKQVDLAKSKRLFVYSFGGAEGLLLDRLNPGWKSEYFKHPLSTDPLFEVK
jgi:hypothetical protein